MQAPLTEREEIEALLPWYVTRRIDADDRLRVEAYLEANPALRAQLPIVTAEIDATIATAEAVDAPSPAALDRLLRAAEGVKPQMTATGIVAMVAARARKGLEAVADWLAALTRLQLGAVAAAASLLIAMQAGSLLLLPGPGGPATYETASGPREGALATGTYAIVAFKPSATAGDISRLFEALRAEIVEGPKAGIWRVRLAHDAKSPAEAEVLLAKLRARGDLVAFTALAQP